MLVTLLQSAVSIDGKAIYSVGNKLLGWIHTYSCNTIFPYSTSCQESLHCICKATEIQNVVSLKKSQAECLSSSSAVVTKSNVVLLYCKQDPSILSLPTSVITALYLRHLEHRFSALNCQQILKKCISFCYCNKNKLQVIPEFSGDSQA